MQPASNHLKSCSLCRPLYNRIDWYPSVHELRVQNVHLPEGNPIPPSQTFRCRTVFTICSKGGGAGPTTSTSKETDKSFPNGEGWDIIFGSRGGGGGGGGCLAVRTPTKSFIVEYDMFSPQFRESGAERWIGCFW